MEKGNNKESKEVHYSAEVRPKKKEKDEGPWLSDYVDYKTGKEDKSSKKRGNTKEQNRLDSINDARSEGESKDLDAEIDNSIE